MSGYFYLLNESIKDVCIAYRATIVGILRCIKRRSSLDIPSYTRIVDTLGRRTIPSYIARKKNGRLWNARIGLGNPTATDGVSSKRKRCVRNTPQGNKSYGNGTPRFWNTSG